MKKMMIAAVVAVAMAMGVYAEEAAPKADAKAEVKADVKVCADCAKLNKDLKAGEVAKLCPACQKACDAKKAAEAKK